MKLFSNVMFGTLVLYSKNSTISKLVNYAGKIRNPDEELINYFSISWKNSNEKVMQNVLINFEH
jgi:hypothetical protein